MINNVIQCMTDRQTDYCCQGTIFYCYSSSYYKFYNYQVYYKSIKNAYILNYTQPDNNNILIFINYKDMIKLYWNIGSQPARAVKALLDLGKIQHETIQIDLRKNQTRTPQYLKINPLGQIPFIVTSTGLGIGESSAIMQFLCEKYPQKLGKYYGDLQITNKTKINVFLSWYQSYFRPVLFARIKIKVYGTIKQGIPHTQSQITQADKQTGVALGMLQNFLKQNQFLVGNTLSIADLLVYFETTNLIYYQMESILKQFQHVFKWYQKISEIQEIKNIQQKWKTTVEGFKEFMDSAKPIKG